MVSSSLTSTGVFETSFGNVRTAEDFIMEIGMGSQGCNREKSLVLSNLNRAETQEIGSIIEPVFHLQLMIMMRC